MKTTLLISLEEDVTQFLNQQGEVDPSAFINEVLRKEKNHQRQCDTTRESDRPGKVLESAPSATKRTKNDAAQLLEELSDEDSPAAE